MKLTNMIRDAFVNAAMQDVPKVDYDEQAQKIGLQDALSQMPPELVGHYEKHKNWFNHTRKWVDGAVIVRVPTMGDHFEFTAKGKKQIDALVADARTQRDTHDKLRSRLRGIAYGVTTRKALAEALPEFEKYLPAEEPRATRNLPAIANLVSEFTKAGWPKSKATA